MTGPVPFDYLSLMGIQTYRPRRPLAGAAPGPVIVEEPVPAARPPLSLPDLDTPVQRPEAEPGPSADPPPQPRAGAPRFNLMAIAAGRWLWLEELTGEHPAPEQLRLVEAMSEALLRADAPDAAIDAGALRGQRVTFRWPLHGNDQQFDQGPAAAAAALAAFVLRQVADLGCRGVVLLGEACTARFPPEALGAVQVVTTAGTAEMLARPLIKRRVWQDLQLLLAAR